MLTTLLTLTCHLSVNTLEILVYRVLMSADTIKLLSEDLVEGSLLNLMSLTIPYLLNELNNI